MCVFKTSIVLPIRIQLKERYQNIVVLVQNCRYLVTISHVIFCERKHVGVLNCRPLMWETKESISSLGKMTAGEHDNNKFLSETSVLK